MSRLRADSPDTHSLPPQTSSYIPSVVIVGRPNVGKSSLFNRMVGQRIAIVDRSAGVTRDRISAIVEDGGHLFELWDTGGMATIDDLGAEVQAQIEVVLAKADVVLFVTDAQPGLMPLDREIAQRLRKTGKTVLLAVNKVDHPTHEPVAAEFHSLGFDAPVLISALHGYGRRELLDVLAHRLVPVQEPPDDPVLRLAIVGRQNVGKSTLINTLAREERMIVSETPGTTRDAVDVRFQRAGRTFVAVDTAGLKRKSRSTLPVEFYSMVRAYRAIRRCDIALHMLDATTDITRLDKRLAATIETQAKPCMFVVNKWDLAENKITPDQYVTYINANISGLSFAPVCFISAIKGTNVDSTIRQAESLFRQAKRHVATAKLNEVLKSAVQAHPPRASHGKRPNLFYATQIAAPPPTFVIFASHPKLITAQYSRYLVNFLRSRLPFAEVPLRVVFRARPRGKRRVPIGGPVHPPA